MSFESIGNLFSGEDPDYSPIITAVVLTTAFLAVCILIPCSPSLLSFRKIDDKAIPYTGTTSPAIESIIIYPVKSCAGISLPESEIVKTGLKFDRHWVIVGSDGRFRSQRRIPKMALITPSLPSDSSDLTLRAKDMPDISIPVIRACDKGAVIVDVGIWSDKWVGVDQGVEISKWLSEFLKEPGLRLVRMDESLIGRPTDSQYADGFLASFCDGFPFLLTSIESLEDLNRKTKEKIDMRQFRPNIVVRGAEKWAEDNWVEISVNEVVFRIVKPCSRCSIPTINQDTGERMGKEPTNALGAFRKGKHLKLDDPKWAECVFFGQNVVSESCGSVKCGDRVKILRVKKHLPTKGNKKND